MTFDGRKYIIIFFILIIGFLYLTRLFYMQVVDDTWVLRAQEIAEKRKEILPPRAIVFDRNGRKIVANKTYYNLMFIEDNIVQLDTIAFAKLIKLKPRQIRERFDEIKKEEGVFFNKSNGRTISNYQSQRAYPFLKELTLDEMTNIAPYLGNFPGFYEEATSMRSYPFSNGANIFGYLNEASRKEIEKDQFYRPGSNIGRAGIERFYEKELRGRKGIRYVVTSALNNAIQPYANGKYDTIAKQYPSLSLGLDIDLQAYGELLMKNKKGCIVAIEPTSGEILAMISAPSFDPNLLVGRKNIRLNYPKLAKDLNKPLFPRPLQAEYPPGSIFKLIQSLIALQEGVITSHSGFVCNKELVGCHNHPSPSGIAQAIQYSCNPYFYAVVKKIIQQKKKKDNFLDSEIGLNLWHKYMSSFGLGKKLETDISGQRPGLIPDSKYYDRMYGNNRWAFSTIQSISIGQGEIKLTPLQMANIAAIIANKGWYITPHFVRSIGKKGPLPIYLKKNYTMINSKHFSSVIEGMRRVVNEEGGTGIDAHLDDVTICGKTGTVQNSKGQDHSVFIAFAPMENPQIAIAVFVENGGAGGTWAAAIASLVIEKYLLSAVNDKAKEKIAVDGALSNFVRK